MFKAKIIETRLWPQSRYVAITLFGFIITRDHRHLDATTINHERIHCCQQLEWLYLPFFVLYIIEWLYYLLRYRDGDKAYRAISFEREAYANSHDPDYLRHRKPFANYRRNSNNNGKI